MCGALLDLWDGDGAAAWRRCEQHAKPFRKSLLLLVQLLRTLWCEVRGGAALAAAAGNPSNRARLLRVALRDARRLARERVPWCRAQALSHRATVAYLRGRPDRALADLRRAEAIFAEEGWALRVAVCRHRIGQLLGGPEGDAMRAAADERMLELGAFDPLRTCRTFAPGFSD
jgi:hypothetical protein